MADVHGSGRYWVTVPNQDTGYRFASKRTAEKFAHDISTSHGGARVWDRGEVCVARFDGRGKRLTP